MHTHLLRATCPSHKNTLEAHDCVSLHACVHNNTCYVCYVVKQFVYTEMFTFCFRFVQHQMLCDRLFHKHDRYLQLRQHAGDLLLSHSLQSRNDDHTHVFNMYALMYSTHIYTYIKAYHTVSRVYHTMYHYNKYLWEIRADYMLCKKI